MRALARVSRLLERSTEEVNLAHYRVLVAVASGDERASRVAERLALGKPAVSAAVDALHQRGLLSRSRGEDDRRVDRLRLTDDGAALLDRVEAAMAARLGELCRATPDADAVLTTLGWLAAAIDETRDDRRARRQAAGAAGADRPSPE